MKWELYYHIHGVSGVLAPRSLQKGPSLGAAGVGGRWKLTLLWLRDKLSGVCK